MDIPQYDFRATTDEQREEILAAVARTLDRAMLIMGPELENFEAEFARYCGARHALGVGNGLDALTLSLRALDIGEGDEVIVPSQTFVATWLAVSHVGASPVAVDIAPDSFGIDPDKIGDAITCRTRAIMPVHLFGHPVDMDRILAVAGDIPVIEDAAQAHGATYRKRRTGGLGRIAGFSFYPTKNLGAYGDGGAIVTDDNELAARLRKLRNYGSERKYVHESIGYNSRLDELQAAILRVKLTALDHNNSLRRAAAAYYTNQLSNLEDLIVPSESPNVEHVYHQYVVRHARRDRLAEELSRLGVRTAIHYPTTPGRQLAYRVSHGNIDLPEGDRAAATSLSLPFWPQIAREQQDGVVAALRQVLGRPLI